MQASEAIRRTAQKYHVTEEEVRREMQLCLEMAQNSPDPAIRARWAAIPRKGDTLTPEEFIEYTAGKLRGGRFPFRHHRR